MPPVEQDPDAASGAPEGKAPASTADDAVPMHALGRVGRPHGLDGAFVVTRPKAEHLTAGTVLTVAGVERRITRRGGTDQKPVLRLEGVDGIDAAERLRGTDLLVPRSSLPPLPDDEYWPDDLVGLPVRATTGEAVGAVVEVLVMPSVDVLRVRWSTEPGRPDLLVPLHREAVPVFDVAARDVAIDLAFLDEDPPATTTPEEG